MPSGYGMIKTAGRHSIFIRQKEEFGKRSMKKKKKMQKKTKKWIAILTAVLLLLGGYVFYVFQSYYRLQDNIPLEIMRNGENSSFEESYVVEPGKAYMIMTYNIGFGAYRPEFSFFMDGGKSSWAKDKETVMAGVAGMGQIINDVNPDFALLQEVDLDGTRSYHVDELSLLNQFMKGYYYTYAQDYDSPFLFLPPWQPHGANKSCIVTYTREEITDSVRRSLPISEGVDKLVDLDRCYSITRVPVSNDKRLCIYNVHLSAYGGSEETRTAQLTMLYQDMEADYKKGNYVICGGDFNHNMKGDSGDNTPLWAANFPVQTLPEGFRLALDSALPEKIAHDSCRDAKTPYEEGCYTVTLDGFLISENVMMNYYQNMDWGYAFSDHDPVIMQFILKP